MSGGPGAKPPARTTRTTRESQRAPRVSLRARERLDRPKGEQLRVDAYNERGRSLWSYLGLASAVRYRVIRESALDDVRAGGRARLLRVVSYYTEIDGQEARAKRANQQQQQRSAPAVVHANLSDSPLSLFSFRHRSCCSSTVKTPRRHAPRWIVASRRVVLARI